LPGAWSQAEVVVTDYLTMLAKELRGETYNKSAHRRAFAKVLNRRNDGSIERKHQNISAVLIELGWPFISGCTSSWESVLHSDGLGDERHADPRSR
jgi:hypothetical protein